MLSGRLFDKEVKKNPMNPFTLSLSAETTVALLSAS